MLNPGYISGTVTIDGVSLKGAYITTRNGIDEASIRTYDENYTLTVNTPVDGASTTYTVYVYSAHSGIDNYMRFKPKSVAVSDGQTSNLDFNVNPGFVDGHITVTGATLNYAFVSATLSSGEDYTYADTRIDSDADGNFSFPVQPNSGIKLYGDAVVLTLTGKLLESHGSKDFEGTDCILIKDKGK